MLKARLAQLAVTGLADPNQLWHGLNASGKDGNALGPIEKNRSLYGSTAPADSVLRSRCRVGCWTFWSPFTVETGETDILLNIDNFLWSYEPLGALEDTSNQLTVGPFRPVVGLRVTPRQGLLT